MKVTCKTGSGKTTFVSAFVEFLIKYIKTDFKIYLQSSTFNQNGWDRRRKKLIHVSYISEIKDMCDSIIICNDLQVQLKGFKILAEIILNKRHKNLGVIQCEQYAQSTDVVQKMNADYFVLLGTFTLGDCQYFVEKIYSSLDPRVLYKIYE